MQKSADAFRTISEVADDLSLPQHVLRFWETRFPQIRPLKRAGGRRYYRPADVSLLRAIRQLLYDDGYTIKGVQRLLKEQGTKEFGAREVGAKDVGTKEIADLQSDPADFDEDDLGGSVPGAPAETIANALEPSATGVGLHHRHLIEDALRTVEDCKRILDSLLQPERRHPDA